MKEARLLSANTESDCAINSIEYTFMWTTQQDWNTAMFHLIDATAIGEDFTLYISNVCSKQES